MKEVLHTFDTLRGTIRVGDLPGMILMEMASKCGAIPELQGGIHDQWQSFLNEPGYPQLQAAAHTILSLEKQERLRVLDRLFEGAHRGKAGGAPWISREVAQQIAELAVGTSSARCSFGWSLHPALHLALRSEAAAIPLDLAFTDQNPDVCDLAALCAVALEVEISVYSGMPFERLDEIQAATELSFPPLGWKLNPTDTVPKRTLDWMGATETVRLTGEAVAIADQLAQAPHAQSIISLSAGALFRTVGVEATARDELIASGRLRAVLDVPSGMTYYETGIGTGILVLSPEAEKQDTVRFLDLSAPHLSTRTSRGRYEAKTDLSWRDAIAGPPFDEKFGRDVSIPEIEEQGRILTVSRYLSRTAAKLDAFSKNYNVVALSDLVDLVRPVALPKAEDGEYVIYETAPGDIGEDGFLAKLEKPVTVDRGALHKARNQQLEAGDVILSVKGTIGRVGIVPDTAPGRNENNFWTVGQSMMILRPRENRILPEVLYEYLSSDVVQQHFETLAGGAVIMSFNMKDLKGLPIPVPTMQEQQQIADAFRSRQELYADIQRIRDEIDERRSASWPHHDLGADNR